MLNRTLFFVFLISMLQQPIFARDLNLHDFAIRHVKTVSVATFQAGLPDLSLQEWLNELFRGRASIRWEANDCHEPILRTVDPGIIVKELEWERPLCVQASAVYSNKTKFIIIVLAGTWEKTVKQRPKIREIQLAYRTRQDTMVLKQDTITVRLLTGLKDLERSVRTEPWKRYP